VYAGRAELDALCGALKVFEGIWEGGVVISAELCERDGWAHSSDSNLRGWGVSRTRSFGLWNLYRSELDVPSRKTLGDIPSESEAARWPVGHSIFHAMLALY
jgi:hypothetical protein